MTAKEAAQLVAAVGGLMAAGQQYLATEANRADARAETSNVLAPLVEHYARALDECHKRHAQEEPHG